MPGDGLRQLGPVGHAPLGLPDRVDDRDVVLGAPQVGEPDELDGAHELGTEDPEPLAVELAEDDTVPITAHGWFRPIGGAR